MTKERRSLTQALLERIEELGLTKEQASKQMGVSSNAVSRWSSDGNWSRPSAQYAETLMDFLGISLDELATLILVDELVHWGLPVPG